MHCPADIGTSYLGTFYGGRRDAGHVHLRRERAARRVEASPQRASHLSTGDGTGRPPPRRTCPPTWPRWLGTPKPGVTQSQGGVNPGGPIDPGGPNGPSSGPSRRQGRLPDSSRSNSPSLTPRTNASHSASVK